MNKKELTDILDNITTYLSILDDKKAIYNFLRDLLSEKEIVEFSRRFEVAQMLEDKFSYSKIEQKTWMSSTTIARISKYLNWENNWYKNAIKKLKSISFENHKGHCS